MTNPERAAQPDDSSSVAAARPRGRRAALGGPDASGGPVPPAPAPVPAADAAQPAPEAGRAETAADAAQPAPEASASHPGGEGLTEATATFTLRPASTAGSGNGGATDAAPDGGPAGSGEPTSQSTTAVRVRSRPAGTGPMAAVDAPTTATVTSGQAALKAMQQKFSSAENPTPRAGRNLFQAIGVGVLLGALVLCSLLIIPQIFMAVIILAVGAALWEVRSALMHRQVMVPLLPTSIGALAIVISAALNGPEGVLVALAGSVVALVAWRAVDGGGTKALRDILSGVLVLFWVPFMASFAVFMLLDPNGAQRVLVFLLVPIANDTVGYIVGSRLGKHPMLPSVSPKKSWEGFVGSLLGGTGIAVASTMLLLDAPYWVGLIMGPLVVLVATMGDLCESLIKRDLGVKDMGTLLPGHGGVMDRLDSILLVAPLMYFLMDILI
ncbi:phosphatidate cytidylyltransferase [Micrococcales bacterium 31B]|nr:phosphatidate cytidylyltransferase [Micrococcales bacterium 31B]